MTPTSSLYQIGKPGQLRGQLQQPKEERRLKSEGEKRKSKQRERRKRWKDKLLYREKWKRRGEGVRKREGDFY